jgi:hypothetical protein
MAVGQADLARERLRAGRDSDPMEFDVRAMAFEKAMTNEN